jgi:hypothetical protein
LVVRLSALSNYEELEFNKLFSNEKKKNYSTSKIIDKELEKKKNLKDFGYFVNNQNFKIEKIETKEGEKKCFEFKKKIKLKKKKIKLKKKKNKIKI